MSSPASLLDDPRLTAVIGALASTNASMELYDSQWRLCWMSDELKRGLGEFDERKLGYGKHMMEAVCLNPMWIARMDPTNYFEQALLWTPMMVEHTPGGKAGLLEITRRMMPTWDPAPQISDEDLASFYEHLEPLPLPPVFKSVFRFVESDMLPEMSECMGIRLHDDEGGFFGILLLHSSAVPASLLSLLTRGDVGVFERMADLAEPGRRQAAILFADLRASGSLSRRLPSAAYFRVMQALITEIDRIVAAHGGLVGKHVGDGATAFFLSEDAPTTSRAARAAIEAARQISTRAGDIAKKMMEETGLIKGDELLVNVGVHWGATLYMGQLVTGGRLEVSALGDEVNECARIQECAQEGEALASKALIERLTEEDADVLGLDLTRVRYLTVGDLPEASEKALRDAGGIAVTVL